MSRCWRCTSQVGELSAPSAALRQNPKPLDRCSQPRWREQRKENTETETETGAAHLSWQRWLGARSCHPWTWPPPPLLLQWSLMSLALQCLQEATGQKNKRACLAQVSVFSRGAVNNTEVRTCQCTGSDGILMTCTVTSCLLNYETSRTVPSITSLSIRRALQHFFSPGNCMNLISR